MLLHVLVSYYKIEQYLNICFPWLLSILSYQVNFFYLQKVCLVSADQHKTVFLFQSETKRKDEKMKYSYSDLFRNKALTKNTFIIMFTWYGIKLTCCLFSTCAAFYYYYWCSKFVYIYSKFP